MKLRKKLILTLAFVAMLVFMLAMSAFAAQITVTFYNEDNSPDETVAPEGKLDIEAGAELVLPNRMAEKGYSYNWYADDGRAWSAGTTVRLYENANIKLIKALDVSDYETFKSCATDGQTVRLVEDITVPGETVWTKGEAIFRILLNGHNIVFTRTGNNTAIGGHRTGTFYYGVGKVIYNGNQFQEMKSHQWGGDANRLFVGRDVEIYAPNAILAFDGEGTFVSAGYPYIQIYGKVTCKTILEMRNGNPRSPKIDIYEGAYVTVTDQLLNHTVAGNSIHINVSGGTVVMDNSTFSFFRDTKAVYNIVGGNFFLSEEDDPNRLAERIAESQMIVKRTIDGKSFQCVIPASCGTVAGREHDFKLETKAASCCEFNTTVYRCNNCNHTITFRYGERTQEHNYEFVERHEATKTELGWELSRCTGCLSVIFKYIQYNPLEEGNEVLITVKTGSTETEVTVKVKDLFVIDFSDKSGYTLTDIKAVDGKYALDSIVKISLPFGVDYVNIANQNEIIKEVIVGEGIKTIVTSIANLTNLETLTIQNATVTFEAGCTSNTLKTINANTKGANITFGKNSFADRTNLTAINMCEGVTYNFGESSFKGIRFNELRFEDGYSVSFTGPGAFAGSNAEFLYVGKGITSIDSQTFKESARLKMIVLMDVNSIGDNAFYKVAENAKIYHHASSLSLGDNAFSECKNVSVYTKAPITNSNAFKSCSTYTIYYGIEHEYSKHTQDASCSVEGTVTYNTSCSCGSDSNGGVYKLFVNDVTTSSSYEVVELVTTTIPKIAHNLTVLVGIEYTNGYTNGGSASYRCSVCGETEPDKVASYEPLFKCLGYSVKEFGGYGLTVRYEANNDVMNEYRLLTGSNIEFGMVVANKAVLGDNTPLNDKCEENKGSIKIDMTAKKFDYYEITLNNIKTDTVDCRDLSYVLSVYVYDGKKVSYLQENETVNNPSGVTYNEVYDILNYAR